MRAVGLKLLGSLRLGGLAWVLTRERVVVCAVQWSRVLFGLNWVGCGRWWAMGFIDLRVLVLMRVIRLLHCVFDLME